MKILINREFARFVEGFRVNLASVTLSIWCPAHGCILAGCLGVSNESVVGASPGLCGSTRSQGLGVVDLRVAVGKGV